MKQRLALILILNATLCAGVLAQPLTFKAQSRQGNNQTKLAKQAKITIQQAREIALKRAPGTIEAEELEKEHGKLVYSFDIRNSQGTITEVQVNAKNGSIASVEAEDAQAEAEEKKKEKQKGSSNTSPR